MMINKKKFSGLFIVLVFVAAFFYKSCLAMEKSSTLKKVERTDESEMVELAQEVTVVSGSDAVNSELEGDPDGNGDMLPSGEYVRLLWDASSRRDFERIEELYADCQKYYGKEADLQEASLGDFPVRSEMGNYQALNDVATCAFIRAEAYMNAGKSPEAMEFFQDIIDNYRFAQAWDPRGWYWSVAEKSDASLKVLKGEDDEYVELLPEDIVILKPQIHKPATEDIVDYAKYGEFKNVGTENYQYVIHDIRGLAEAVGEGIYPNSSSIYSNPRYKIVREEGRLKGSHWDFVNTYDLEAAYFKWATASESWGVRLFYLGLIFERSEMFMEALRAYRALVVHFPETVAWTDWQTPWYPADAAVAKIKHIIRVQPQLELDYKWMRVMVRNGFDNIVENDAFITYPGKMIKKGMVDKVKDHLGPDKIELKKVKKRVGKGKMQLVQYDNGHWQLLKKGKPFIIKGITYAPTKIGQSPDNGTLENWMFEDSNNNGIIDGPYEAWVDANRNNIQDPDELVVGDFQLMKEMGVNAIRVYHVPETPNKELLRDMYNNYGIGVIMSDFLGKYAIGSGATWAEGTDYENEEHKKNMLEQVKKMVMDHKDEPYVLMWMLGNENNYGVACNANTKPAAFYSFVNEVALWIKSVDKNHPVAINNGDTLYLDVFAEHAPDIDIFSANVYRGDYGFGSFWSHVNEAIDRPAFILEYGSPAYAPHKTLEGAEKAQADYHLGNWMDIEDNMAGNARGVGNSLGGVIFEWLDEWWKNYEPYKHDRKSDAIGPFPGGYYFEEWFGIVGQGNGRHSPFMRQLRETYFLYKKFWNAPHL
jgi:tetratricopeptide (TPR) repeat protein